MLNAIQIIAERKINEAMQNGGLEIDAWKGRPLPKEDTSMIPPELRMAFKVLKNAGYLPPEIEARKEMQHLEELIAASEDEHARLRQMKKLNVLKLKLAAMRNRPLQVEESEYYPQMVEKVTLQK